MIKSIILVLLLTINFALNAQIVEKDSPELYALINSGIQHVEESNYTEALSEFKQLLDLAEAQKIYKYVALANLNIGVLYWKLSDHEKALNYYFQALDVVEERSIEKLYNSIYNNIGVIYSENNMYEKAYEYFNKAYDISLKRGEENRIGMNLINLSIVNKELKKYDAASVNLNEALIIFKRIQDSIAIASIYNNMGTLSMNYSRYNQAKTYLKKALAYANINDNYYQSLYLLNIGHTYYMLNQFDSSVYYLKESLKFSEEINHKENSIKAYKYLAKSYDKNSNTAKAFEYINKSNNWKDSLLLDKKKEWVSEIQIKYELEKVEKEVVFLERKKKLQNIIWILSSLSLVTFFLFIIYSYRLRNIKSKQRNALLENEKKIMLLEEEEAKAKINYLDDQMKSKEHHHKMEMHYKNLDLSSKALVVVKNTKIITDINSIVKRIDLHDLVDAKQKITHLKQFLDKSMIESDNWDEFLEYFDKVHHGFFKKLKKDYPIITQSDMKMCAYIVMNMETAEIAKVFSITPNSVRKRKQRFIEKCNLSKDADIKAFLNKFMI